MIPPLMRYAEAPLLGNRSDEDANHVFYSDMSSAECQSVEYGFELSYVVLCYMENIINFEE